MAKIHPKQIDGRFQAVVDFGFASGGEGDTAKVTVTTPIVRSDSMIVCSVDMASTLDHSGEDAAVEGIHVYPSNIVSGVSFDLVAVAPFGTWGKFLVNARL